jgi:hypothetical protein
MTGIREPHTTTIPRLEQPRTTVNTLIVSSAHFPAHMFLGADHYIVVVCKQGWCRRHWSCSWSGFGVCSPVRAVVAVGWPRVCLPIRIEVPSGGSHLADIVERKACIANGRTSGRSETHISKRTLNPDFMVDNYLKIPWCESVAERELCRRLYQTLPVVSHTRVVRLKLPSTTFYVQFWRPPK